MSESYHHGTVRSPPCQRYVPLRLFRSMRLHRFPNWYSVHKLIRVCEWYCDRYGNTDEAFKAAWYIYARGMCVLRRKLFYRSSEYEAFQCRARNNVVQVPPC